jgi:hypothetical protein
VNALARAGETSGVNNKTGNRLRQQMVDEETGKDGHLIAKDASEARLHFSPI